MNHQPTTTTPPLAKPIKVLAAANPRLRVFFRLTNFKNIVQIRNALNELVHGCKITELVSQHFFPRESSFLLGLDRGQAIFHRY